MYWILSLLIAPLNLLWDKLLFFFLNFLATFFQREKKFHRKIESFFFQDFTLKVRGPRTLLPFVWKSPTKDFFSTLPPFLFSSPRFSHRTFLLFVMADRKFLTSPSKLQCYGSNKSWLLKFFLYLDKYTDLLILFLGKYTVNVKIRNT